jgi:hypothetical protein
MKSASDIKDAFAGIADKMSLPTAVSLLRLYEQLEEVCYVTSRTYRQHSEHSLNVFLTGLYILAQFEKNVPQVFGVYFADDSRGHIHNSTVITWLLASLFHDLAYPVQLFKDINDRLVDLYHGLGWQYTPGSLMQTDPLDHYAVNTFTTLYWPRMEAMIAKRWRDSEHGALGCLTLLRILANDDKHGSLATLVGEAARAILAHNDPGILLADSDKLSRLLILCDEIQEWHRRSKPSFFTRCYLSDCKTWLSVREDGQKLRIDVYVVYPSSLLDGVGLRKWTALKARNLRRLRDSRVGGNYNVFHLDKRTGRPRKVVIPFGYVRSKR